MTTCHKCGSIVAPTAVVCWHCGVLSRADRPRYYVTTYDHDRGEFTPQCGVRSGPYKLFALRKALRALRDLGYDTDYKSVDGEGAPSVRVERR